MTELTQQAFDRISEIARNAIKERDVAREALSELVRLKNIKERWDNLPPGVIPKGREEEYEAAENAYFDDYSQNKDAAWDAARKALTFRADGDEQ